MTDQHRDPLVDALRGSLAQHADQAPDAGAVAERIIRSAGRMHEAPPPRPRRWRALALPVIAAGAVGAVVAGVVAVQDYHPSAHRPPAAASSVAHPSLPSSRTVPVTSSAPPPTRPARPTTLRDVRILDLTFAGPDDGWALASAACLSGSGRCTALLRTTDGTSWRGMPGAAFNVDGVGDCADPCVQHLRFANDRIGYAFGPAALFLTTDGGASWHRQPGGADALETLNGDVIRLVSDHSGCPGPCNLRAETAAIGSSRWSTHRLGRAAVDAASVEFVRSGRFSVVMSSAGQAGALRGVSLYTSADDGRSWTQRPDPCRSVGAAAAGDPASALSLAAGGDGSVSLLCAPAGRSDVAVTVTSTDGGRHYTAGRLHDFGFAGALAAASAEVLVVESDRPVRSTDGGRTWRRGDTRFGGDGSWVFAGFQSTSVGRVVAPGGRTIWTTRDAGAGWSPVTLP
jgi:photosystem II stability/assembly factor-like uncharacterized protein